jgi:hypothetical protein
MKILYKEKLFTAVKFSKLDLPSRSFDGAEEFYALNNNIYWCYVYDGCTMYILTIILTACGVK